MKRQWLAWMLGLAVGGLPVVAKAAPGAAPRVVPRPARPTRAASPARATGGRLDQLALGFALKLLPALKGRPPGSLSLMLQVRQPPGVYSTGAARLARVLAQLVTARLGAVGYRHAVSLPPQLPVAACLARARKARFQLTLLVQVVQAGGRLHLRGRVYDTNQTLWGRLKQAPVRLLRAPARLLAHVHDSLLLGPDIGVYTNPRPLTAVTCSGKWQRESREAYWGAEFGDVDGDGRQELVLLAADAVVIRRWSVVYKRFDTVARVPLPGPAAAVKPRFTLASLRLGDLDGDRKVDIIARSSERSGAVVITHQKGRFIVLRRLAGYPLGVVELHGKRRIAVGEALAGRAQFNGRNLTLNPAKSVPFKLPPIFHSLRFGRTQPMGGVARSLYAVLDTESRLLLRWLDNHKLIGQVDKVGRAFALGDLTGDGQPELITSAVTPFAGRDALVVRRPGKAGPLCRVPAFDGSVTALAVGDLYLDGTPRLVALVWRAKARRSYLLVVR